ncbi:MAG: type II toxin-antitoxin system Phd/YefM family antitoxin [Acidimicrobiia bacterium]
MKAVGIHEAKTNFSRLLRRVAAGEEVVITRSGSPVARIVPVEPITRRVIGIDAGAFTVPDDFNDPIETDGSDLFGQ